MNNVVHTDDIYAQPVEQQPSVAPVQKQESGKLVVVQEKKSLAEKLHLPTVRGLINTPWMLLTVPLLAAAGWLGNNTWVITNNLDKPYLLLAGPATIGSIVAIWLLVIFCRAIITGVKKTVVSVAAYLKKPAHRFWIGTTIFLVASIIIGGQALNEINKDNDLYGLLGYAIEIAVDTTSVFSIIARQGAVRRHDDLGKKLFSFTLILSASFSTIANAYYTKNHYLPADNMNDWFWTAVAFVLASSIPLFIMILSVTSDYVTDQESSTFNADAFEAEQKDRTRFYQIQLDSLKERKVIEDEINVLKGVVDKKVLKQANVQAKADNKKAKAARPRAPFISFNFGKKSDPELLEKLLAQIEEQTKKFTEKTDFFHQQFDVLQKKVESSQQTFEPLFDGFSDRFSRQYKADLDNINQHFSEVFSALDAQKNVIEEMRQDDEKDATFSHLLNTGELEKDPETDPKIAIKKPKVTQKLSEQDLTFGQKSEEKDEQKQRSPKTASTRTATARLSRSKLLRNVYTSSEAARAAKCTVQDIEEALTAGDLAMSVGGKILKSSLEKFIIERREKSAQKAVVTN